MKLILTIFYITAGISVFGQTITESSLPKVNSQNSYYTSLNTDLNEILKVGANQTWDISGVSGGVPTTTKYEDPAQGQFSNLYPQATYFVSEGGESEVYYISDVNGVKILGSPTPSFINPGVIEKGEVHPPVFEIKTPMSMGAVLNQSAYVVINIPISIIPDSIINTIPIKPDSLRLKINTTYNYECTGSGILKCPGKDFSVLQQTANITTVSNAEAKLPFLGWIDVSTLVDFGFGQEQLSTMITFWSPDHTGFVAQFEVRPDLQDITVAKYTTDGTLLKSNDQTKLDSPIDLFPNPFNDQFSIRMLNDGSSVDLIRIASMDGKTVFEKAVQSLENISTSDLVPGPYMVYLMSKGNTIAVKKVIKQ